MARAAGGTIGAELHLAGESVVLIARGAHLDAIQRNGLRGDALRKEVLSTHRRSVIRDITFTDDVVSDDEVAAYAGRSGRSEAGGRRRGAGDLLSKWNCERGHGAATPGVSMMSYLPVVFGAGVVHCTLKKIEF